jgi:hypothetical protein
MRGSFPIFLSYSQEMGIVRAVFRFVAALEQAEIIINLSDQGQGKDILRGEPADRILYRSPLQQRAEYMRCHENKRSLQAKVAAKVDNESEEPFCESLAIACERGRCRKTFYSTRQTSRGRMTACSTDRRHELAQTQGPASALGSAHDWFAYWLGAAL